jgi:hypothetical protein
MTKTNDSELLINLIKTKKLEILAYPFNMLEEPVKEALLRWLTSENFPINNPTDLIGTEYVLASFNNNYKLHIFNLSYEEEEQCAGTIVFSLEGQNCKYVIDTVECSS